MIFGLFAAVVASTLAIILACRAGITAEEVWRRLGDDADAWNRAVARIDALETAAGLKRPASIPGISRDVARLGSTYFTSTAETMTGEPDHSVTADVLVLASHPDPLGPLTFSMIAVAIPLRLKWAAATPGLTIPPFLTH